MARIAGVLFLKINGVQLDVVGDVTINYGRPKREMQVGLDGPHGHKEMPQIALIKAKCRDRAGLDLNQILIGDNATVVVEMANGKAAVLRGGVFTGDGTLTAEDATFEGEWSGMSCEEI
jgi:hypothetical protein